MKSMGDDFVVHHSMLITVADIFIVHITHTWINSLTIMTAKISKTLQIIKVIAVVGIGIECTIKYNNNELKHNVNE